MVDFNDTHHESSSSPNDDGSRDRVSCPGEVSTNLIYPPHCVE